MFDARFKTLSLISIGLPPVMDFIRRRRLSVFGHAAWLTQGTLCLFKIEVAWVIIKFISVW